MLQIIEASTLVILCLGFRVDASSTRQSCGPQGPRGLKGGLQ